MKAELIPENGEPPIPVTRDITVVGRRGGCDIWIDHPSISKQHCVLVRTSGLLILRDLASTNGTKVKGQRVRWAALLPGDKVSLGSYKFRIYLGPDDAPSPSELRGRAPGPMMTGFAPPTPPIAQPVSDLPASEARDAARGDQARGDHAKGPGEDDGQWEKLPTPSGGNAFFIELE
ncbi:FHA domain-containing protein [Tautonia sp. JC769]|uniref:FHA domain-containing protein n=1 Tax=Tautonia sp. JC769 TaxID=3232135 RepID=UPI003459F0AE